MAFIFIHDTELVNQSLPPVTWLVNNLLPQGLCILAGRPKSGKSFLALNMAISITRGRRVLDFFPSNPACVLYVPYEDSFQRMQSRTQMLSKALPGKSCNPGLIFPERVSGSDATGTGTLDFPRLTNDCAEFLETVLKKVPEIKLIIFDTLQRALAKDKQNRERWHMDDFERLAIMQRFALEHGICILFIHHSKKNSVDDDQDTFSGAPGLFALADVTILLETTGNADDVKSSSIHIQGRDIPDTHLPCLFNKRTWRWSVSLEGKYCTASPERQDILHILCDNGKHIMTVSEIADKLGKSRNLVSQLLKKLLIAGLVKSPRFGCYQLTEWDDL